MAYNIIFYFSDQQRWDTCGCFGQPLNITPNLDKLAAEGVKFDNAKVTIFRCPTIGTSLSEVMTSAWRF